MKYPPGHPIWKHRRMKLLQRRKEGCTYRELAEEFNLSRERCAQLVRRAEYEEEDIPQLELSPQTQGALQLSGIFGPQGRDKWYEALPRPENASECERWAKEIVAFLSQHSDEDLLRIRGIGPKRLEELREFERRAA